MTLNVISSGVDASFSTKLNQNLAESLNIGGKNLIRVVGIGGYSLSSTTDDWYVERYTGATGYFATVETEDLSRTTAQFLTDSYIPSFTNTASSDTIYNPNSFTGSTNPFDLSSSTYAIGSASGAPPAVLYFGTTFAAKTISKIRIKIQMEIGTGSGSNIGIGYETYNGAVWGGGAGLASGTAPSDATYTISYDGTIFIAPTSVQGIRIYFSTSAGGGGADGVSGYVYTLQYGDVIANGEIEHAIPSGRFSSTVSKAFFTPLIKQWETTSDIQFKLKNTTEDTGWLTCGNSPAIQSFTAFTSSPTKLVVKLIAQSTATSATPSIYGVALRCT